MIDLAGPETPGSTAGVFDSPYGAVYDFGVQRPALAALVARGLWGTDLIQMYDLMDQGIDGRAGDVVVDVPVGGAPVLQRAPRLRATYIGVDLSAAMLRRAATVRRRRGFRNVHLLRADAAALPIDDASVDRVLCFNGLHVIPDKDAVMRDMARVLRPGGQILGSVIVRPPHRMERLLRPWTSRAAIFFHPADAERIRRSAETAGFSQWRQWRSGTLLLFRGVR